MRTRYAIGAAFIFFVPVCHASTGSLNFSVSPSIVEIKVYPNSTKTINLSVLNNNSQDLGLSVSVLDLTTDHNGNTNVVPANSSPFSCTSWITPEKEKFAVLMLRTYFIRYLFASTKRGEVIE